MTFADVPLSERGRTVEARVLLAALHQDRDRLDASPIDTLTPEQWAGVVALAGHQRVRPLLHQRLHETGRWRQVPATAWRALDDDCRRIAMQKIRMHAELAELLKALQQAGIPTIALKGAVLGPVVYGNLALREMLDLDIMVPRPQLESAVAIVVGLGYAGLRAFNVTSDAAVRNHVTDLVKPGRANVELHWNICVPGQITSIDAADLWQRARTTTLPGVTTHALSPEDLLLHLCFHASFHHEFEFGLRPFCDIARVIACDEMAIQWPEVVRLSTARRWERGVALCLALAAALVGAAVPDDVITALSADADTQAVAAEQLVWTTPGEAAAFTHNMAGLSASSWPDRLRTAARHVFVSQADLTAMYASPPDNRWWRLLYARRIVDVVRRNFGTAMRLLGGRGARMSELAERRHTMRAWLSPSV